jgi:hypothetical protein
MVKPCVWILGLGLGFMLAGCASAHLPAKPASAAQSLVSGSPDEVASALVQEMSQRQFVLTRRTAQYLAFDRPIDNAALWPQLGGSPDALPRARVVMTLTPVGPATRVAAEMMVIAEPGTSREHFVSMASLGVDPRMDDILGDAQATVIADRGSSDPRIAFATARIPQ